MKSIVTNSLGLIVIRCMFDYGSQTIIFNYIQYKTLYTYIMNITYIVYFLR